MSNPARVLLVDDNEINLQVAEGLITSLFEIECDMALSGVEALSLAENNKYSLVFMDQMMPEMDGLETTQRLRAMGGNYVSVPIIALTANVLSDVKGALAEAGMNDYLSKPIVVKDLSAMLKKWLPDVRDAQVHETDEAELSHAVSVAKGIPEINVTVGLANVGNKDDAFETSLKLLHSKIPKIIAIMESCLDKFNLPDFTIHVHGMKSSLAIVGAASLSAEALELEKAGKNGDFDFCKLTLPGFVEGLRRLEVQLSPILDVTPSAEGKAIGSGEAFSKLLTHLAKAVSEYDYDTIVSTITTMTEHNFGEKTNTSILKLKDMADFFDYDGLNELISELENE